MTGLTSMLKRRKKLRKRRRFAMRYYQPKLDQIEAWVPLETEDSNFYYELTELNRFHLASLISAMTGETIDAIEAVFAELDNDRELVAHLEKYNREAGYGRDIRFAFGRRLGWYALTRLLKPRVVIETGVDMGVGSCVLCSALMRNRRDGAPGRYYGTEIRTEAGALLTEPYSAEGEIIYGDSIESLKAFDGEIDLFINDSDHSADYEYDEYLTVDGKLSEHAVILGDNSHVTDKLPRFARETGRNFVFFREQPDAHWYPGAGIGIAFRTRLHAFQ